MTALAFALECAAVIGLVGLCVSAAVWPPLRGLASPRWSKLAALRADLAFLLGSLPAVMGTTAVAAAAAPSIRALLAGTADHCATHSHHLHLCLVHSGGIRPSLAAIGALFSAVFAFRAWARLEAWREERSLLRALEAMGRRSGDEFPVVAVPGSPWLCHATGIVRPRGDELVLEASAADAESLALVEDVLGRHLERFGARRELTVSWQRDG